MKQKNNFTARDHTFVICAYKESKYLKNCIRSLENQTVKSQILIAVSYTHLDVYKRQAQNDDVFTKCSVCGADLPSMNSQDGDDEKTVLIDPDQAPAQPSGLSLKTDTSTYGQADAGQTNPQPAAPQFGGMGQPQMNGMGPVSYTHLDVYKRQGTDDAGSCVTCMYLR